MPKPEPRASYRRYVALAEPAPISGAEACRLRQELEILRAELAMAQRALNELRS